MRRRDAISGRYRCRYCCTPIITGARSPGFDHQARHLCSSDGARRRAGLWDRTAPSSARRGGTAGGVLVKQSNSDRGRSDHQSRHLAGVLQTSPLRWHRGVFAGLYPIDP